MQDWGWISHRVTQDGGGGWFSFPLEEPEAWRGWGDTTLHGTALSWEGQYDQHVVTFLYPSNAVPLGLYVAGSCVSLSHVLGFSQWISFLNRC